MDISSGTIKFEKSFEEWNFSSILGGNDIKLCFYRICNIVLPLLSFPSGESSLSRFSGAMTQNSVFVESCNIALLPYITPRPELMYS